MAKIPLAAAMLALLASACTVGPNYHAPALPVPPRFAEPQAAGAGVDPATWWTVFRDPVLDDLVARALKDSPDIAVAASRVRQARLQEIVANASGKPTLDATANASHIEFSKNAGLSSLARAFGGGGGDMSGGGASGGGSSGGGSTGSGIALPGSGITTYSLGFDAGWELDLFGGVRRGVEAATARADAAIWDQRDAAVTLTAEVAQAYLALRLDQQQAAIIAAEIDRQKGALRVAGNIAKVGLVPQVDVTRQRGSLTSTEARLEPVRADIEIRRHALAILTGQPPAALDDVLGAAPANPAAIPPIPAGLPSDLLRRRPDVRSAERQLAAATADIGVATADLYPRFNLTGIAQLISTALSTLFTGDSLQLTATGAAQFPLVDWGKRRATVKIREESRDQAYQQYRLTVLSALREVEDQLATIDAERRRNAALRHAVEDTEHSARAIDAQYRTGFVAQDSLLNAEAEALQAREQLAQSDAQLRQASVALFKAIGGGWSESIPAP